MEWIKELRDHMEKNGWRCFDENEEMISFETGSIETGRRWRDYYKDTRHFFDYNPDQKINIRVSKEVK